MNYADKCVVRNLIHSIIGHNLAYQVLDPEDVYADEEDDAPLIHKKVPQDAMAEFGQVDCGDLVQVLNSEGASVATFYLVYANGNEWEPMVTISDYAGKLSDKIYGHVERMIDRSCTPINYLHSEPH